MQKICDYNIIKYIDSLSEVRPMLLEGILSNFVKCDRYKINDKVKEYLYYVDDEPFYISPSFSDVKSDNRISTRNPKFMLFSAAGATGKSALAKYIAYKYNALYWNLAKLKLGTNSFSGTILNAIGPRCYSDFISNLNSGKTYLVIDAFDEAEIISGRKMVSNFITEISETLTDNDSTTVILLARTETAQFIASHCVENGISLAQYEIGFFLEDQAKEFIRKSILRSKTDLTSADTQCIDMYYSSVKKNISEEESHSFLGYAPVLEAMSKHIEDNPNRQKLINELSGTKDCTSIIIKIMDDLLLREQEKKVVMAFEEKNKAQHPEFHEWDKVYSLTEQLVRLVNYILFGSTDYKDFELDFLPPQLIDSYQELLNTFLPQHPFVRSKAHEDKAEIDFAGPAFRDYTLVKLILDDDYDVWAHLYFDEKQKQHYFPSQIFYDCYVRLNNNHVAMAHLQYLYDSFRAKATALERAYIQVSEIEHTSDRFATVILGMMAKKTSNQEEHVLKMPITDGVLKLSQLSYASIDTPNMDVELGNPGVESRISASSIICRNLIWNADSIIIEAYDTEGCLLVASEPVSGTTPMIEINGNGTIKVSVPNIREYYKLVPYAYDFNNVNDVDIIKFIHALRCIFIEFRTHRKDTLGKDAERIDNVTVGNNRMKKKVLQYLKQKEIIYQSAHLYKIDTGKMQQKGINYAALARMDVHQLSPAFREFNEMK